MTDKHILTRYAERIKELEDCLREAIRVDELSCTHGCDGDRADARKRQARRVMRGRMKLRHKSNC
jgi:hypothetical protein